MIGTGRHLVLEKSATEILSVEQAVMSQFVCVRTFPTRSVAEVARAALEARGIASTVSAADAGYDISFASGGAKLLVDEDSANRAKEILSSIQELSALRSSDVSESTTSDWRRSVIWIGLVILVLALVVIAF